MKARIKATGEVVDIITTNKNKHFEKEINWEQRTWEASISIMCAKNTAGFRIDPKDAVELARNLVTEYKKQYN